MRKAFCGAVFVAAAVAVVSVGSASAQPALDTYVVVLDANAGDTGAVAGQLSQAHGGTVGFVYRHALKGFSIRITAAGAAAIAHNPHVAYVERDQEFSVSSQSLPTGIQRVFAPANEAIGIDGVDDKRVDVDVAVIDTGIDLDHPDLNVAGSTSCVTFLSTCGSGGDDGNGHGTHVAGTIGALDNGIGVVGMAPGARLWAVRVLGNNGTGTTSQIIAGMDWVTARASTIEVANVSITGGASTSVDAAVNRMADAGIAVAVAAGNDDANASAYSPARAGKVLTVSAMADYDGAPGALGQPPSNFCLDQDDTLADFSNWGSTIEITAPGCRILSTYSGGGYAWINGTSMASPHVAGALALLASKGFPRTYAGVSGLYSTVVSSGNLDWLDESGDGVKEPLLDVSGAVFAPVFVGAAANQPPTASFTSSCAGLSCAFDASASADTDGSIVSYAWTFGDGESSSSASPSSTHLYLAGGTYTVALTTTDDDGATATTSESVIAIQNQPPTASFTSSCDGLSCAFNASASSDPDGSIVSYGWTFGDGGSSSSASATTQHLYLTAGTYTVTLTTTDDDGATATTSRAVSPVSVTTVMLSPSSVSNGSKWTARVTVSVTRNGSSISTTVSGTWSKGASGTSSCSTTPAPCVISKSGIQNRTTSATFTVKTVGGSANFSGPKTIVVARP
jgi:subtilisin family serine protease